MQGFPSYTFPLVLVHKWPSLIEQIGAVVTVESSEDKVSSIGGETRHRSDIKHVSVKYRYERAEFLTCILTSSGEPDGVGQLNLFDGTLGYKHNMLLCARIVRVFLASGARPFEEWTGTIYCRHLYLVNSPYALGINPFEKVMEPTLADANGTMEPIGDDCWRITFAGAEVSLYTGPAYDSSADRFCNYWAIDYPSGVFGVKVRTEEIAKLIEKEFERAGAVLVL